MNPAKQSDCLVQVLFTDLAGIASTHQGLLRKKILQFNNSISPEGADRFARAPCYEALAGAAEAELPLLAVPEESADDDVLPEPLRKSVTYQPEPFS
jgi:hypothetical protein